MRGSPGSPCCRLSLEFFLADEPADTAGRHNGEW